ncbi:hypothetical protein [Burkholderia ubonensis]|uniref:hypothetical protein n=1 Tax=Burkholderia ubonensis TaxID=101571 RepID=UPI00114CDB3D|nr:hypothetical protein [Burkholderia ubonensis]MDY7790577.1 hypothetical protein [Burkholderia ubonensis]
MRKTFAFLIAVSMLAFFVNVARTGEVGRIFRDDCRLSFLARPGLEYVEVDGATISGNDACYIAFKYTGNLKLKSAEYSPAMPDDWRALVDVVITVNADRWVMVLRKLNPRMEVRSTGSLIWHRRIMLK